MSTRKKLSRALLKPVVANEGIKDGPSVSQPIASPVASEPRPKSEIPRGLKSVGNSAWNAGAADQARSALSSSRDKMVQDILDGQHEMSLLTDQISDKLGTDRRSDWAKTPAFLTLKTSIEQHGQDTPIQVWPSDPNWTPDRRDPENVTNVAFDLITGRRRHAVAQVLGRPIRAVLASPAGRGTPDEAFDLLFMRFRENDARENLGAFERFVAIGEMFEAANQAQNGAVTASAFARKIGIHETMLSRSRGVFSVRDEFLSTFRNAYDMSVRDVVKAVASLKKAVPPAPAKTAPDVQKLQSTRKIGSEKLTLSLQGGKLSIRASGMQLDIEGLEALSDVLAAHLKEHGLRK